MTASHPCRSLCEIPALLENTWVAARWDWIEECVGNFQYCSNMNLAAPLQIEGHKTQSCTFFSDIYVPYFF